MLRSLHTTNVQGDERTQQWAEKGLRFPDYIESGPFSIMTYKYNITTELLVKSVDIVSLQNPHPST